MRQSDYICASRRQTMHWLLMAATAGAFAATPALAGPEEAPDARAFIDELGAEVLKIIKSPDVTLADRRQRFRDLFHKAFDVEKIGRFVVGRYWNRASPGDQAKYLDVFGNYVSTIYANQFSQYQGQSFKTNGVRQIGDGESVVQSEIDRPGNPPIQVAFRVGGSPGKFKIVDVTVEGVSLIVTKRDEFGGILAQEGVPGVIKRMQSVVEQGA